MLKDLEKAVRSRKSHFVSSFDRKSCVSIFEYFNQNSLPIFYKPFDNLYGILTAMKHLPPTLGRTALTLLSVILSTLAALGLNALGVADSGIMLTLLMGVVLCSWAFGLPYSVLASVLAILVHSYFFSVPIYSFAVYNPQHLIAFVFLVAVGVVVSTLSARLRDQVRQAALRESRLSALHRLTQALSGDIDRSQVVQTAESLLSEFLDGVVRVADASLPPPTGTRAFALTGSRHLLGWLTVENKGPDPFLPERRVWIETLLAPVVQALERVELIETRSESARELEATKTRNTILHGISHDLRTPLTVISATADALLERTGENDSRRADLQSLAHESHAVVRQVEDLLELTSLTSGKVAPRLEWVPAEDLVYPCLEVFVSTRPEAEVNALLPDPTPLCQVDETLVTKALANLLENAAAYAPGPIEVSVAVGDGKVRFAVADRGPGVPDIEKLGIFEQFVRGGTGKLAAGHRGSGLGLALVQTVAKLHGGGAGVDDRPGGGSVFWFSLTQPEPPALWGPA